MIHNCSLIIIKYKNKYLLYDDQRWKCKLFINYKTVNKHYYWMTMNDMLNDKNIKEKNLEVVEFVKKEI